MCQLSCPINKVNVDFVFINALEFYLACTDLYLYDIVVKFFFAYLVVFLLYFVFKLDILFLTIFDDIL